MSLIRARYRAVNTIMNLPRGGYVGLLDLFPNAAAAYSLRKLRAAYSGAAVRVRRSSDNTEQDIAFDANGELDTASLLSFVNADVNTFASNTDPITELGGTGAINQSIGGRTDLYKFTYTGGATTHQAFRAGKHPDSNNTYSVIFNIYFPTGQACNGFSYLKPDATSDINHNLAQGVWHSFSYTDINGGGNLSRFIPSVNGVSNTADDGANFYLDAWIITQTSADGAVTTWYDQSLSNDATQTTASNQPKIVSAGSLVTENGKVSVDFDGVNDAMNAASANLITGNSAYGIFTVGKSNTILSSDYYWGVNATQNGTGNGSTIALTPEIAVRVNGNCIFSNSASGVQELLSLLYDGTTIQNHSLHINGVNSSVSSSSSGTSPMNVANGDFRIAGWGSSAGFFDGTIQEIIVFPSNQSANRTGIEANINNFYSIYP